MCYSDNPRVWLARLVNPRVRAIGGSGWVVFLVLRWKEWSYARCAVESGGVGLDAKGAELVAVGGEDGEDGCAGRS